MTTKPTVFVVDDDKDARDSVCALVQSMKVDSQGFASAEEFLGAYDGARPACLITDFRLPGINGLMLQEKLASDGLDLPVIIISGFVQVSHAVSFMKAGAEYVLEKPCDDQELWDTIQNALRREGVKSREKAIQSELDSRFAKLTGRERVVMDLVVSGMPNKAVAMKLGISLRTVEDRRRRIMKKLSAESFAELVEIVIESRPSKLLPDIAK